jgi:hypothetical protein
MTHDQVALILQTALLGEVSSELRGVAFALLDREVQLVFYYDGPASEDDQESASCVETEVIAALPEDSVVVRRVVRADAPSRMPNLDRWVYRRRE